MTPVAVWFQPVRFLETWASGGVNVFFGPEVENSKALSPSDLAAKDQEWFNKTASLGVKVVIKRAPSSLPLHCVGLLTPTDEPNGKGIAPAQVKAEADALRAKYPGVTVFCSLAGDKITSANFNKPAEKQLYTDYAAAVDVITVNWYAKNRNANRYPITHTGDAIAKLRQVTTKPIWAWVECNDQQLPPPSAPDINRAPTPDEIEATVGDCIGRGAAAIGWFPTCDSGKYSWPASYRPTIDRNGASMSPQYDRCKTIAGKLNGPPLPPPSSEPTNADLMEVLDRIEAKLNSVFK